MQNETNALGRSHQYRVHLMLHDGTVKTWRVSGRSTGLRNPTFENSWTPSEEPAEFARRTSATRQSGRALTTTTILGKSEDSSVPSVTPA